MRYFPIFLDLKGKLCVVVGGGRVGERKVRSLLRAGARVKVIAPEIALPISRWGKTGKITHSPRPYRSGDLRGAFLAIAATGDRRANGRVFLEAQKRRIPVNVVDDPAHSSFIVPSIVAKRDLVMAISTSGRSPALARVLRQKLEKEIGPEYPLWLDLFGALRKKILPLGLGQKQNQRIFRRLAKEDLQPLIKEGRFQELNGRLKAILGAGFSLKELGLNWRK